MRGGMVLCFLAALASAQTPAAPKPFKATAQLGVPYVIGAESTVIGTKEKIEVSSEREVTLDSAELSLVFPNRQRTSLREPARNSSSCGDQSETMRRHPMPAWRETIQ